MAPAPDFNPPLERMDARVDQLNRVENLCTQKLDENCVVVEGKDNVIELLPPRSTVAADTMGSLAPITPDSNTESGDLLDDFDSPLPLVNSHQKSVSFCSHRDNSLYSTTDGSPCTPMEGVFDPFAPGGDKFMMAPPRNKFVGESRINIARQLHFDCSAHLFQDGSGETDAETMSDDEMLLETVYDTLLEAIVSKQTEGLIAEIVPPGSCSDGCRTPDSAPHFSGIAETCPGAPVKQLPFKLKSIDQGLCRKLEF